MRSLQPNTAVLVGSSYARGTVTHTDDAGVHVIREDGEYLACARAELAVVCSEDNQPRKGDAVLVERGSSYVPGTVIGTHVGAFQVSTDDGEEWVPATALAKPLVAPTARGKGSAKAPEPELSRSARIHRFTFRHAAKIWLGLGLLGPSLMLYGGAEAWVFSAQWVMLHVLVAAYVHAQHHPLPRFHAPGFGKPDDPGTLSTGALERAPQRDKWEAVLITLGGWLVLAVGAGLPMFEPLVSAAYLGLAGVIAAVLLYLHDRLSAAEVRRLLGAASIRDRIAAAEVTEGRVVGTASGEARGDAPLAWREVVMKIWSETRQVTKTITDSDGNSQTVQANETTHYGCGIRHVGGAQVLTLDTALGPVEVSLGGAIWAAPRERWFGRVQSRGKDWGGPRPPKHGVVGGTVERIDAGDRVAVLGKLRRGEGTMATRLVGGDSGPAVVFAAGSEDPEASLRRALLRRRLFVAIPAILGLAGAVLGLL